MHFSSHQEAIWLDVEATQIDHPDIIFFVCETSKNVNADMHSDVYVPLWSYLAGCHSLLICTYTYTSRGEFDFDSRSQVCEKATLLSLFSRKVLSRYGWNLV